MSAEESYSGVGIDLGTSFFCLGLWERDHVEIIPNYMGSRKIPACLAFSRAHRFIGDAARDQVTVNPSNSLFNLKRLMGKRYSDPSIHMEAMSLPFKLGFGATDRPMIHVQYKGEEKSFFPEEICAMMLSDLKKAAEDCLPRPVNVAVVSVPSSFTNLQRQAILDACSIAGFKARIISEACAAAIAYYYHWKLPCPTEDITKTILVMDIGGGKTEVTIIVLDCGLVEVKSIAGDSALGGEDFVNRLVDYFVLEFKNKSKKNISSNFRSLLKLRNACEKAKKALSTTSKTAVEIDCLYEGIDFSSTITRELFEDLNMDLFEKCMFLVEKCIEDANLDRSAIDEIILVGGSTRIPKVQELLKDFFKGKELCKMINPDEAVARGAAIHATVLEGNPSPSLSSLIVLEVIPSTISFEAPSGLMQVVFPRLRSTPARKEVMFSTSEDEQSSMLIRVYEGEKPKCRHNILLGTFEICGFPILPKGAVQVLVAFELDLNGILCVSAKDASSKLKLTVVEERFALSKEEIADMKQSAQRLTQDDEDYKAKINERNKIEEEVFNMKSLVETETLTKMLAPKDSKRLNETMDAVVQCLDGFKEGDEWEDIGQRLKELERAWMDIIVPMITKF